MAIRLHYKIIRWQFFFSKAAVIQSCMKTKTFFQFFHCETSCFLQRLWWSHSLLRYKDTTERGFYWFYWFLLNGLSGWRDQKDTITNYTAKKVLLDCTKLLRQKNWYFKHLLAQINLGRVIKTDLIIISLNNFKLQSTNAIFYCII